MNTMNNSDHRNHDSILVKAHSMIRLLELTFPENEKEQKRAFLGGGQYEPRFIYKPLDSDFAGLAEELSSLEFQDDDLSFLYAGVRDNLLLQTEIIRNRGHREIVEPISRELFGPVDSKLFSYAEELLAGSSAEEKTEKTISSKEARSIFEESLLQMGLDDWHVELSPRFIISVIVPRKTIAISQNRFFSPEEIDRLLVHEIGVHVVRAANGGNQPYRIFTVGLPHYGATEEGTAVFVEELMNVIDKEAMRLYAARVLAVKTLFDGLSFKDTFEAMKSVGYDDNAAWQIALRTHRAGGLAKDHIYLKGYLELKERFKQSMDDFRYLFLGKVNVQFLDLLKRLRDNGTLNGPKYVPEYLEKYFQ